ncbi:MAG: DUF2190 family protein [Elusimicrobiota bacterium]|jgi:predicted RecA/RadA family phage recombinase|nr:DUF2190 family protein [Elusimicrobiota bacterium]
MANVYIEKERVSHIYTVNNTAAAIAKNDFVIWGSFCGVADNSAEVGEPLSIHIESKLDIQVLAADVDTTSAAIGDQLYYDETAKKFTTDDDGNVLVGTVIANASGTGGILRFIKI